jgi:hypothetical protein
MGWKGLKRGDQRSFLPIRDRPEGISRPLVELAGVTAGCRGGTTLLTSTSLLFLDVVEVFREDDMCGCQGKLTEEGLVLVMREMAKRPGVTNRNGASKLPPRRVCRVDATSAGLSV